MAQAAELMSSPALAPRASGIAAALQGGYHLLAHGLSPLVKLQVSPVQLLGRGSVLLFHLLIHRVFLKKYLNEQIFLCFLIINGGVAPRQ
jgi:hypothetical protein